MGHGTGQSVGGPPLGPHPCEPLGFSAAEVFVPPPTGLGCLIPLPTLPASHALALGWANVATRLRR
jgi:hypothetical protein